MKRNLLKPFATLLCAVALLFAFSSFTAPESSYRGGGDEAPQLDFHISSGNQRLDIGIHNYILGDDINMGQAPFWVNAVESDADPNTLCLEVQPNYEPYERTTTFMMTVYTSINSDRVILTINIVQDGRSLD